VLVSLPESLKELVNLKELTLHGNVALVLPVEVLGPTWHLSNYKNPPAKPKAILDYYFRNRAAAVKRPILEAKVILVGWGAVGKTSLRRRLVDWQL
jgi:internalin A